MKVVHRNYKAPVGEVRKNPFKTKASDFKRSFELLN